MNMKYHFASDNTAGIIPEAWGALADANQGFAAAYGEDEWTAKASDLVREVFETDCDVYFVFTGALDWPAGKRCLAETRPACEPVRSAAATGRRWSASGSSSGSC